MKQKLINRRTGLCLKRLARQTEFTFLYFIDDELVSASQILHESPYLCEKKIVHVCYVWLGLKRKVHKNGQVRKRERERKTERKREETLQHIDGADSESVFWVCIRLYLLFVSNIYLMSLWPPSFNAPIPFNFFSHENQRAYNNIKVSMVVCWVRFVCSSKTPAQLCMNAFTAHAHLNYLRALTHLPLAVSGPSHENVPQASIIDLSSRPSVKRTVSWTLVNDVPQQGSARFWESWGEVTVKESTGQGGYRPRVRVDWASSPAILVFII